MIAALEWLDLAVLFNFDVDTLERVEELSERAQQYARSFQRGEISAQQLKAEADAMRWYLDMNSLRAESTAPQDVLIA